MVQHVTKSPFSNRAFRTLFLAQVFSLLAIGMLTVALSLLAYQIGGDASAGRILGFLLALKMVAYVGLAPLAETLLSGRPRKQAMIALNLGRMACLLPFVFVDDVWQIAVLAFAVFTLSAGFTPLFQSVIPDLLPDEEVYTRALSWSRIAYTLEALLSPILAAGFLRIAAPESLFLCAAAAFLISVAALSATRFPGVLAQQKSGPFWQRVSNGMTIYRRTPRLRGLFFLNLAVAFVMAWVIVNSVVFAGMKLGDAERYYPLLMAGFGFGSVIGAVAVPKLVHRAGDRWAIAAGTLLFAMFGMLIFVVQTHIHALFLWAGFGLSASLALTPGGLVVARSAGTDDRPAVFAAQFSLSHAGWLIAYPLAGWLAPWVGLEQAMLVLCVLCAVCTFIGLRIWPRDDPAERDHVHPELPPDHPHFRDAPASGPGQRHRHTYQIDELHPHWTDRPV